MQLKVEYSGDDWQTDAKALIKKLIELDGVGETSVGEKGLISVQLKEGDELKEETLKKLAKDAGMKFVSLAEAKPDETPKDSGG